MLQFRGRFKGLMYIYLARMYLAFFQRFWLLHFQKHTHILMPIFKKLFVCSKMQNIYPVTFLIGISTDDIWLAGWSTIG